MEKVKSLVTILVLLGALAGVGVYVSKTVTERASPSTVGSNNALVSSPFFGYGEMYRYQTSGTCNTGTTTLFAIQNPWSATSTVTYASIYGTNGATSTDILVSTSTLASPSSIATATSSLTSSLFGIYNLAANKYFFSVAGVVVGDQAGYVQPISGTYPSTNLNSGRLVVGPNQYILGFATSTNPVGNGGTSATSVSIPSCSYKLEWVRGF